MAQPNTTQSDHTPTGPQTETNSYATFPTLLQVQVLLTLLPWLHPPSHLLANLCSGSSEGPLPFPQHAAVHALLLDGGL